MAGRKRRKVKLVSEMIVVDRRVGIGKKKESEEQQTWSELPTELLELIMSHLLTLKENICASAVCKRWLSVAISVRVVNRSPWIMYFPKSGNLYEFYNPEQYKTYFPTLPQLQCSRVCYTKDSWLLLYRPRSHWVFFFNPFTQELIKLPKFEVTYQVVAFSSSPTSPGCVVFTIKDINPTGVPISTCYTGATEWTTVN